MLDNTPPPVVCPAAEGLAGPPIGGPSVVCRVITQEMRLVDYILESRNIEGMAHVTALRKGPVLAGFCCGKAMPRIKENYGEARAHYTYCPVWQASEEAARRRQGHGRIFEAPERPKIMGEDPEVVADLLGLDVEQVIREEARFRSEHPASAPPLGGEILQGDAAVLAAGAPDSEWGETE